MGCIALQSATDEHCSICEETVYVEILDERGATVLPGQTGRVVVTSLYNYATPFIRYEIGDYAMVSDQPDPAGRRFKRLQRITGRKRNALLTGNGDRLWEDSVITDRFGKEIPSHVFQIRQPDLKTIEVAYVCSNSSSCPNVSELAEHFTSLLGSPITVKLAPVNEIARSSGGKRERIVTSILE